MPELLVPAPIYTDLQPTNPDAPISVWFHGQIHDPYVVQNILTMRPRIFSFFGRDYETKLAYLENFEHPDITEARIKRVLLNGGFVNTLIRARQEGLDPDTEISEKKISLLKSYYQNLPIEDLIFEPGAPDVRQFLLLGIYDQLLDNYDTDIKLEANSRDLYFQVSTLVDIADIKADEVETAWGNRNIRKAISSTQEWYDNMTKGNTIRERGLTSSIKDTIRSLVEQSKTGLLFLQFGRNHLPILSNLQQDLPSDLINWQSTGEGFLNSSQDQAMELRRLGKVIPDEIALQTILDQVISTNLVHRYAQTRKGQVGYYLFGSTIHNAVDRFCSSYPSQEIQRLCEGHQDPLEPFLASDIVQSSLPKELISSL